MQVFNAPGALAPTPIAPPSDTAPQAPVFSLPAPGTDAISLSAPGGSDPFGRTKAMQAAIQGNTEQVLAEVQADPAGALSNADNKGQTLPDYLMLHDNVEALDKTLSIAKDAGVDVAAALNTPAKDGYTTLAWAAENGKTDACKVLLNYGAKPSIPEAGPNSPDKLAASLGWPQVSNLFQQAQQPA